ncbi:MAG: helicase-related protein [Thermodesulfobium sp.]
MRLITTDRTFITNEEGIKLVDRFKVLIQNTRFFDCLVGYFFTSGFYALYPSLESTEKIRILVGMKTDIHVYELIEQAKRYQQTLTDREKKEAYSKQVENDLENSPDTLEVELGAKKFVEWINSKKLEIRVYPSQNIHAKLYIMTFQEGGTDDGRVITGSSNFTEAGLVDNLEFNVELKNSSDYKFAQNKFNELWKDGVDVSAKYVETVKTNTWLNENITPYELYLKFLYEYFKDKINLDKQELLSQMKPPGFKDLEYQKDAVRDAKSKLEEYGGVFISDVVGLGKTYMTAMLLNELDGDTLVIAPPTLLDENNPGSWGNVLYWFGVRRYKCKSIGKLDEIINGGTENYTNIVIDESHRFRNEATQMYSKLLQICKGKRIILVSATPLNNSPKDILAQIKLFQDVHKSTLPNPMVRDLESYFNKLQNKLKDLDREEDKDTYLQIVKHNADEIRKNVLQYLMVRRTRSNIEKYYEKDLKRQKLEFPEVNEPEPVIYTFDKQLDKIFNKTLELVAKDFTYSRYTPLLYLREGVEQPTELSQKNMRKFMKVLLLKRLESSFYAFKQTVQRFINSYKRFIEEYEKGNVYVSKKYASKIFELIDDGDLEAVDQILSEGKAEPYKSSDFKPNFKSDLKKDIDILNKIWELWKDVKDDPKLGKFVEMLSKDKILKTSKLIVFTESKETSEYLEKELKNRQNSRVLAFSSSSHEDIREKVIANFDANARNKADDYQILISTDILSEGVNLHRSNAVINYDIPWNPIKMMQRVGRINRVDTKFKVIYTYNFFPAGPIDENIKLKAAAQAKIEAFIEMLGNDARLLTDEEIKSHDLFDKLNSKKTIIGDDEEDYELKYLMALRKVRDEDKELFNKVINLPKKARSGKKWQRKDTSLITFFRKGKLQKIFIAHEKTVEEVDFASAAKIIEAKKDEKREDLGKEFYSLLDLNKQEFNKLFEQENGPLSSIGGRSGEGKLLRFLSAIKHTESLTEDDKDYISKVNQALKDGGIDKGTIKRVNKHIGKETDAIMIVSKIKEEIPLEFLKRRFVSSSANISGQKEIILSEYLTSGG